MIGVFLWTFDVLVKVLEITQRTASLGGVVSTLLMVTPAIAKSDLGPYPNRGDVTSLFIIHTRLPCNFLKAGRLLYTQWVLFKMCEAVWAMFALWDHKKVKCLSTSKTIALFYWLYLMLRIAGVMFINRCRKWIWTVTANARIKKDSTTTRFFFP